MLSRLWRKFQYGVTYTVHRPSEKAILVKLAFYMLNFTSIFGKDQVHPKLVTTSTDVHLFFLSTLQLRLYHSQKAYIMASVDYIQ